MKNIRVKFVIILFLLSVFGGFSAFAQETIAVHPLDNTADTSMAQIFFDELVKAIPVVPDYMGDYRSYVIDLVNNLPADVPPGGFPSYICPPPSLTSGAAYGITGEVGEDDESPGEYWVRLYLWQLEEGLLLVSDMVSASDRAAAVENYPYMLAFFYSKIDEYLELRQPPPPPPIPIVQHIEPPEVKHVPLFGDSWLFVGARAGAGTSSWKLDEAQNMVTDFMNFSAAIQAIVNIFYPIAVQTEVQLQGHFARYEYNYVAPDDLGGKTIFGGNDNPIIWDMTVPLFACANMYSGILNVNVYAGPYLFIPMPIPQIWYDDDNVDQSLWPSVKTSLGLSYGISLGFKVGHASCVFVDGRFSHLFGLSGKHSQNPFNGTTFSVGYQIGLIDKKK